MTNNERLTWVEATEARLRAAIDRELEELENDQRQAYDVMTNAGADNIDHLTAAWERMWSAVGWRKLEEREASRDAG